MAADAANPSPTFAFFPGRPDRLVTHPFSFRPQGPSHAGRQGILGRLGLVRRVDGASIHDLAVPPVWAPLARGIFLACRGTVVHPPATTSVSTLRFGIALKIWAVIPLTATNLAWQRLRKSR